MSAARTISGRPRHGAFRPPDAGLRAWHIIETHQGRRRLLWRPGTEIWHAEDRAERWTSETAYERRWAYICIALDQREETS